MEVTKKEERGENKEVKRPEIDSAIIEELMKGYEQPSDLTGPGGIMEELHKRLYERVLGAELTHYLGYGKGEAPEQAEGQRRENYRNGSSKKTLLSEDGKLEIDIARDRTGEFEPQFIRKGQKRFGGFNTKIIAMYAQGMTVREIKRFLEEQYKVEVSSDLISTVTDSVMEDVVEWQNRPLEPMYAVVFFDALRVKIRDEGTVKNKAVYLALGIHRDGTKEVLGLWIQENEGAKFWLGVMNELNHRGLKDILVAVIDGLKRGFPEAIRAVYPDSEIQTCIVHLIRNSLSFCNWKDRKPVAAELKKIYNAETAELAAKRLEDFERGPLGKRIPAVAQCWRRVWDQVIPFFAYPNEIRKIIYTTNAIESLHMQLRKVLKARGHFPSDEAATKLIYLVLRDITKKWKNSPITWKLAATQFTIRFGHRFLFHSRQARQRAPGGHVHGFCLFLVTYITNHTLHGDMRFQGPGPIRYVYFPLLISHIGLSVVALPMILITFFLSLSGRFSAHRRLARFTFPIWLYVSVSGVIVYAMPAAYR